MNRRKLVLPIALVLLLSVGAIYGASRIMQPKVVEQGREPLPTEVTITLTDKGFEPKDVTIEANSAVRFKNASSFDEISINSDDHPTHQKYKGLNLGSFSKNSSVAHIFKTSGVYGFHDHYHPQFKGTITVK